VDWKGCGRKFSRPICVTMWFEVLCGMEQMIRDSVMTHFEVLYGLERV
jgi:hypothetical protein